MAARSTGIAPGLTCLNTCQAIPRNTSAQPIRLGENNMALLVWVPELDTGIDEIDRQHRRIVDYINKLYELRETHDRDGLGEVIGEMVDYTLSHFVFEESLMESAGYLFSGPHKKVHELFTRRVAEMQSRFDAGEDVANELHNMLSRWLFNHIRNEDHGYVDSAKAYLRMARESNPQAEKERLKAELLLELEQRQQKKGWLARLFSA
jgi:hemerythrin